MSKQKLLELLNKAVELEHAASAQYLSHAEQVNGLNADPVIARFKEIAGDELKHAGMFRSVIGMLGGTPSKATAETHDANDVTGLLKVNLKDEMDAVNFYRTILEEIRGSAGELRFEDLRAEHEVRHVIMDEMEHVEELRILLGLL